MRDSTALALIGAAAGLTLLSGRARAAASSPPRVAPPSTPAPPRAPRGIVIPGEPTRVDRPAPKGDAAAAKTDSKLPTTNRVPPLPTAPMQPKDVAKQLAETDGPVDLSELPDETVEEIEDENIQLTKKRAEEEAAQRTKMQQDALALRAAQLARQQQQRDKAAAAAAQKPAPTAQPIRLQSKQDAARQMAPAVADNIRAKQARYDRALVARFQSNAGLQPDGLYGPATRSALAHFGVVNPPPIVFKAASAPSSTATQPVAVQSPLDAARKMAPAVASNIATRRELYDRSMVRQFQQYAGLSADGLYGPATRDALARLGVSNPPSIVFKGASSTSSTSSTPAPSAPAPTAAPSSTTEKTWDLARARRTAEPVAAHIRTKKDRYDRKMVASFQKDAGLTPDGLYGPSTAAALRHFGVKNSPPAVFKGSVKTYTPPE